MTEAGDIRTLRRWLLAERYHGPLLLACAEHPGLEGWLAHGAGAPDARVLYQWDGCLALAPPAAFLELVASGVTSVTVLLDGCSHPEGSRDVIAQADALLTATGHGDAVEAETEPPRADRRRWGRSRSRQWVTRRTVPVRRRALLGLPTTDPVPVTRSEGRGRTIDALRRLGGDAGEDGREDGLGALPSGAPRLDAAGCAGTGVCVKACPVQALTLTTEPGPDGDERFALALDAALCTDCGACLELCPEQALERAGEFSWSDLVAGELRVLARGTVRRCTACRAPHAGDGDLCAVCAFRRANPFGTALPPGWRRPPASRRGRSASSQ